jgi:hypothetical protein
MKSGDLVKALLIGISLVAMSACSGEQTVNVKKLVSQPKTFVGSDTCKMCHLEHYDSWKMTLHSRAIEDVQQNKDAIIVDLDEKKIREQLGKVGSSLKVPAAQIYIPKVNEIRYVLGSQWQQRFLVEKDGQLFIAPIQYSVDTDRWVNYHEADWDKRPFLQKCGGCHATGVDLEKKAFIEPRVGCEACHGKGSWHSALPKTAVFEKRQTIVNPAKLTQGIAAQICGSCHKIGESTTVKGLDWPAGYEPGKSLKPWYRPTTYQSGDVENFYPNEFSKGHHGQYNDWEKSAHFTEGVTCTSCHYVHQIGLPPTRSQTVSAGSKQCFECHEILNKLKAHNFHSFGNCVGCHMPRIGKNAETGDLHSHVFMALLPKDTIKNPAIPNSCQTCHAHKDADLKKLQEKGFPGSMDKEEW